MVILGFGSLPIFVLSIKLLDECLKNIFKGVRRLALTSDLRWQRIAGDIFAEQFKEKKFRKKWKDFKCFHLSDDRWRHFEGIFKADNRQLKNAVVTLERYCNKMIIVPLRWYLIIVTSHCTGANQFQSRVILILWNKANYWSCVHW